ncbi:MAG TPA: extracellular solute-binding protein [Acidimicrobiales bacterium]|nr:extracellular solute-binding protein [Acidimicrobiales bacterium]
MGSDGRLYSITRRGFLQGVAAVAITPPMLAACGGDEEESSPSTAAPEEVGAPSTTVFEEPASRLSGDLTILMWSHFVPSHDEWFDTFARDWGQKVGVNVTVDHINTADVPGQITSEISAGSGHDLIQHIAAIPQYEPSVLDLTDVVSEAESRYGEMLDLCRRSSFNPNTEKFFAYAPGWVPDPGNFRRSLWEPVGLPDGPTTWDELLEGGREIRESQGVQLGIGMSQEIDSNMAGLALLWSFGSAVQDEDENVVINSPETVAAVEYMAELFKGAMTDEVFAWNAASNNQGMASGSLSYIINSISAYRTAQEQNPVVANDVFFVPALDGPEAQLAAQHVLYNWIVPNHAANPDAAKEFLLHYTANYDHATYNSKLYDFPAFVDRVPNLDAWVAEDPFGSEPSDKLAFLKLDDAVKWTTNIGHPGPTNPAVGEVFGTNIIPNMLANVARGQMDPEQSVADAERQITTVFERWRSQGLVGGSR